MIFSKNSGEIAAASAGSAIIKDINAMQGFGSMDVLCMDKTGTLTNESILLEYYMDVLGNESTRVLDFAFLNSMYHSGVCNPIDNAILACQTMPGRSAYYTRLLAQYQKTDEIPFDYARKFVSTLVTEADHYQGGYCACCGALRFCGISGCRFADG